MSTNEIQTLAQQFVDGFDQGDLTQVLDMLADDVEVFDHVPYRFDGKTQFVKYLKEATAGVSSVSFVFRQPSYRVYNDTMGVVNAYDTFVGVTKDGNRVMAHGRTTLVFARQTGQWKIVSCHFSAMPQS